MCIAARIWEKYVNINLAEMHERSGQTTIFHYYPLIMMLWSSWGKRVGWLIQASQMKIIDSVQRFIFPWKSAKAQAVVSRAGFSAWINTEQKLVQCQRDLDPHPTLTYALWLISFPVESCQCGPSFWNARLLSQAREDSTNVLCKNTHPPVTKGWANDITVIW